MDWVFESSATCADGGSMSAFTISGVPLRQTTEIVADLRESGVLAKKGKLIEPCVHLGARWGELKAKFIGIEILAR